MSKRKDKSTLEWLAPSMARDGLLKNGDWVMPAAQTAGALFCDEKLKLPAQFLAVVHPYALDYIRTAPVLVVAAVQDRNLLQRKDRLAVGHRFNAACCDGTKLGALLKTYGLAPQLRALVGEALRYDQHPILAAISDMLPASSLAQAIPDTPGEQLAWLAGLAQWRGHMSRLFSNANLFLDWAAVNMRDEQARAAARDVADFAGRTRQTFNTEWTFAQAHAATRRWHEELALRPPTTMSSSPLWRTLIDYAPLPAEAAAEGFTFHALQTREALFEEGATMRHCVRLYADKVARGSSRIYSVRRDGRRIATLELIRAHRSPANAPYYELAQLKGPRNVQPETEVWRAMEAFISAANPHKAPRHDADLSAPDETRGGRSRLEVRRRVGPEIYASWFTHMRFETFQDGVLTLAFPTRFLRNWIQTHYLDLVRSCCEREFAGLERIELIVATPAGIPQVPQPAPVARRLNPTDLNPHQTFDRFVVDSSNQLAHAAATQVAGAIGNIALPPLAPLVIQSGPGLGKSHLLTAIAHRVRYRLPAARVLYLSGVRFRLDTARLLQSPDAQAAMMELLTHDLVLIDDIDELRDTHVMQTLARTVEALQNAGRQVVLGSGRDVMSDGWLDTGLRARLPRGTVVRIEPLTDGLRARIIAALIRERRVLDPNFEVDAQSMRQLLEQGQETVGQIIEALRLLHVQWQRRHWRTPHAARASSNDQAERTSEPRIEHVLQVVCRHYGIARGDLLSQRRGRNLVRARQIAMYLAYRQGHRSPHEIGVRMGGRTSTTVQDAVRRITERRAHDPIVQDEISALERAITAEAASEHERSDAARWPPRAFAGA